VRYNDGFHFGSNPQDADCASLRSLQADCFADSSDWPDNPCTNAPEMIEDVFIGFDLPTGWTRVSVPVGSAA